MVNKRSDQKSLGLSIYMGMAKYAAPAAQQHGAAMLQRMPGRLIWMHAANLAQSLILMNLIGRIAAVYTDANFLLTTAEQVPEDVMQVRLPKATVHQYLPHDVPEAVAAFLDHWTPDICIWSDAALMPLLLQEATQAGIPTVYVNATAPGRNVKRLRWVPGAVGAVLNGFSAILAVDDSAARGLQKAGAQKDRVIVAGLLREGVSALPFDEKARSQVARQLHGRPVWLAAHITASEEDFILEAHKTAQRSVHRLIVIMAPAERGQIDSLMQKLVANGLSVARWSDPQSLTSMTEVLLADVPDELGLWYRVASVSLIGDSLIAGCKGQNPEEPAALGSAIIHGPFVENFADSFLRLAKVGAAVEVMSVGSLAEAVSELLSPDRAAEMAHAAWAENSDGAQVTDQVLEIVFEHLEADGGAI